MRIRFLHGLLVATGFALVILFATALQTSVAAADDTELPKLPNDYRFWYHVGSKSITNEAATALGMSTDVFGETFDSALADTFAIGPPGAPSGFYMLKGDELYQFYVAREARGSGVAAELLADAEARLADCGVATAWLACAVGNDRAARFYEKCGWVRARTQVNRLETPDGVFEFEVWRYEKAMKI